MLLHEHLNGVTFHYNRYINKKHFVFVIGRSGRYIVPPSYWFSVKSTRALSSFRVSVELYDSLYNISTSSPVGGSLEMGDFQFTDNDTIHFNL